MTDDERYMPTHQAPPDDRPHIVDGEFQSDKYPTCPRGKVPLSVKDPTAQDLLWEYAQRRRAVDAEFAADLETCLVAAGHLPIHRAVATTDDRPSIAELQRHDLEGGAKQHRMAVEHGATLLEIVAVALAYSEAQAQFADWNAGVSEEEFMRRHGALVVKRDAMRAALAKVRP